MQHHLVDLLLKDGVYERREKIEIFSHAENRDLQSLNGIDVLIQGGLQPALQVLHLLAEFEVHWRFLIYR
jgi:hypothetical protein